ncbi:MAG TPA: glutamate--tRNA ligase family protein [Candidatus Paceibacterota bacterium]|nr:glutamate--tRNA ligase family protein [Candidatus Paceibacterota bacterium]
MTVKVRIAPSPTGALHVGTARTALFNWLYARKHGGQFILRIEDTDLERSKPEYETDIIDGLHWLGLEWDNHEIHRQSERLDIYRAHLKRLLDSGKAYERKYTDEEKEAIAMQGRTPRDSIIALRQPLEDRDIAFDDEIRGTVSVNSKHIGAVSLAKDSDTPLYNFAVVVDDLEMGISHVIRGEDHISNTPKQLLIYEALGQAPPKFAHLPLILGPDRSKLSKRHGATSINEYRKDFLPQAMVNFMGFLGYTYDEEILDAAAMAERFELGKVHKSGAVFDIKKLEWLNARYLRTLDPKAFKEAAGLPNLPDAAVPLMTERLERLSGVAEFAYLWERPEYDAALLLWKEDDAARAAKALSLCVLLADGGALNQANLDQTVAGHFDGQKGSVYWPLRVALSGRRNSAGPLEIAPVIGPAETKARIETAIRKLS